MSNMLIATARSILKEVRFIAKETRISNVMPWRHVCIYNDLVKEFRGNKDPKSDKEIENSISIGEAYLCYLKSLRRSKELDELYKGHGEISIEDSAARVGLKLPKMYQE